ncbi:MAG: TonB-dependent receptor [Planctomycetes bacterium]|nr:TonB-dependent receptor [Planctomycetota bacterium]
MARGPESASAADSVEALQEVVVVGRSETDAEAVRAASAGSVPVSRIVDVPLSRPGAVLESVPGVVVTQHSGAGKANQFFLRGFNLDHGTDFATSVGGVPINAPSHGHGQGYTDLNFVIPELVRSVEYEKGPYFAHGGDFASAGAARVEYARSLESGFALLEGGSFGFGRALVADSLPLAGGQLLFGIELFRDDGPWERPDDYEKVSSLVRFSEGGASTTLEAYSGDWNATDQVPERAVQSGLIERFDALDASDGGRARRFALSHELDSETSDGAARLTAYAAWTELDLWSNFTYFLDDPTHGDQFLQTDERLALGVDARAERQIELGGRTHVARAGVQLRNDVIDNGLFRTEQRAVFATTREDEIVQSSLGLWTELETRWSAKFRSTFGLRGDVYRFDVESDDADNSGVETDASASPKLGLVFGPFGATEFFANAGLGFHSNDARGVLLRDDPTTATEDDGTQVDPLVETRGAELGVRTRVADAWTTSLAAFVLESDSEILFVGDAGATEASRPSRRLGVEWTNRVELDERWDVDLDAALSHARFTDDDSAGDHVPGAIESTVSASLGWHGANGLFAGLHARYFGPRPLIEDDSVRSSDSFLVDARLGWRIDETWSVRLDVLNLFDRDVNDIEYFYTSQLAGEASGVDDVHVHPAAPFAVRLGVRASF